MIPSAAGVSFWEPGVVFLFPSAYCFITMSVILKFIDLSYKVVVAYGESYFGVWLGDLCVVVCRSNFGNDNNGKYRTEASLQNPDFRQFQASFQAQHKERIAVPRTAWNRRGTHSPDPDGADSPALPYRPTNRRLGPVHQGRANQIPG